MNLERVIRHALGHGCRATAPSKEELSRRAVIEKRSLVKERFTLGLELAAFVLALALPATHLALVAMVLAFAPWIVPDLRIVRLLDFLAEDESQQDPKE
jgi:hypothetical protein